MIWVLYLLAIAGAELVTALGNPIGGIVFHAIILVALILHASLTREPSDRRLFLSLSLAPLIRVLSLSMPLTDFPQIYWYLIVAIPLFAATFVIIRMLNYRRSEVGLIIGRMPIQLLVAATGVFFGVAEFYILRPEPLIAAFTWQSVLLPALIMLVATGFAEELLFRGVMQRPSLEVMGTPGLLYISAVFAALHIGYLSPIDVVFVFVIGLFFAWVVKRTGSLFGVTLSHGIANITLYLITPFIL
ncbi:MAG: lysostaphin resistance A-like protein [Dehalococcoidia bacterium]